MNAEELQQKLNDQDQKIKSLQKELELKTQCLSLITHDFAGVSRNLLWVIEALKEGSIDLEIFQTLYDELKSAAESNQKIISNTIAWVNSQESEFALKTENVAVTEIYAYINDVLKANLEHKQIQLNFAGPENARVTADKVILQFIVKALVENAIKYSHPGGSVTMRIEKSGGKAKLSVEDEGAGMSETVIADLFSFKSSPYTGTLGEKGAGLSLIVVKKFANLHHFDMSVSSAEGSGTKFELTLPVHEIPNNR